ncbi:hypothetical protein ACA910_012311 [Epithemia clementina (nom. ined.)]
MGEILHRVSPMRHKQQCQQEQQQAGEESAQPMHPSLSSSSSPGGGRGHKKGPNNGKLLLRPRSSTSSRRVTSKKSVCFLLYILAFFTTILLCLEHLRRDVLFSDIVSPWIGMIWDVNDDEQVEALEASRAILRGGSDMSRRGDQVLQISYVDHEVKALVDGGGQVTEEDDEDDDNDNNHGSRNNNHNPHGATAVDMSDEEEETWDRVHKSFAKRDAKLQSIWWNAHNIVHVIHTRVLQNQPRLLDYTKARLDQFKAFTLPSIQAQTNNEFLWILWTDPSLSPETEEQLRHLIVVESKLDNAVIIGYKKGRPEIKSPWFHETFDQSYMYGGSYKLLMSYHNAATTNDKTIVLDTYLDSEDAISANFVQLLQTQAAIALSSPSSSEGSAVVLPKVKFWCPSHVVEWEYFTPPWQLEIENQQHVRRRHKYLLNRRQSQEMEQKANIITSLNNKVNKSPDQTMNHLGGVVKGDKGYFHTKNSHDKCLSAAGSTIGLSSNATMAQHFPLFVGMTDRSTWHETALVCDHVEEANCLGFLRNRRRIPVDQVDETDDDADNEVDTAGANEDPLSMFGKAVLLRSKTITGAETKSIPSYHKSFPSHPEPSVEAAVQVQHDIWRSLPAQFGIATETIPNFRAEFHKNLDKVLLDMLTICLPSNACKAASKDTLQEMLATVGLKKQEQQP